jgi:hypothetical protein
MSIAVSLLLIAIGAIITFATNVAVSGVNLDAVGWILILVGAVGLVLGLIFASTDRTWYGGRRTVYRDYDHLP